ncbi:MAG: WYL domain-containing protein, partial [Solobacterium sp.]|nr:WYL domain-containing protein [Solobacterium sp.]
IIDRFGTDVRIMEEDEDHFLAWVQSTEQGLLFLGQQNMDFMEILEPESLRARMKERLEEALEQYR